MFMHHQNAGQNHNIKMAKKSFGNVFVYWEATITNQNCRIPEEYKGR
jgi:hypothetical protein